MTERIKDRISALSNVRDAQEVKYLLDCILADLTEVRAHLALTVTDLAAMRTPIAANVVDVAAMRTPIAANVVDVAAIRTRSLSSMLSPAGLAIGGGSKLTAQAAKPFMAMVNGSLVFKPAATAMSALGASTIAQGKFGLYCWYIDSAGTITTSTVTADADTAAAAFALMPAVPASRAMIGSMIVTDSNSAFVAATDALDADGVTAIYIDTVASPAVPSALTASAPAALTASAPAALTGSAPAALTLAS